MARLGELLLREKLVTSEQLEEALEAQVIHGGRLGTNLCELGFLAEKNLARVLGAQFGVAFASGALQADPNAVALIEANWLDDNDVLPMRVDPTRLYVAVIDPRQIGPLDQIGFAVGRRVVPVVVPEFRMNQLLRLYVKAFRPMRPIDMNTLRPRKAERAGEPVPMEAGELINEAEFARIYAQAMEPQTNPGVPVVADPEEGIISGEVLEDEAPVIAGALLEEPAAPAPGVPVRPSVPVRPVPTAPQAPSKPPKPKLKPLKFLEAQSLLSKSNDREDVALALIQFGVSKFRRVALLNIQGDLLTGWRGAGKGVSNRAVQRIGSSLKEESTFRLVRDLRSHYSGAMKDTPGTDVFYEMLGEGPPKSAVIMPLLVRGKPVHLLYVDAGPGEFTPPDISELLILSQSVARSYDALIEARKGASRR